MERRSIVPTLTPLEYLSNLIPNSEAVIQSNGAFISLQRKIVEAEGSAPLNLVEVNISRVGMDGKEARYERYLVDGNGAIPLFPIETGTKNLIGLGPPPKKFKDDPEAYFAYSQRCGKKLMAYLLEHLPMQLTSRGAHISEEIGVIE